MLNLLLLEDDPDIRPGLEEHLRREGFKATAFSTGGEALSFLAHGVARLDAALLDLSLPDMDGVEVLKAIRADATYRLLPVVLVTEHMDDIDRVIGMGLGADDYVSKPFSSRELVARIRAILRRAAFMNKPSKQALLTFGAISVDLDHHLGAVDGETIELTRREFELLAYFLQNPRRVLSRERILQQVWGLEYLGESRTIDAHVRRIRAKLGTAAGLIETVVGVGYRLGSADIQGTE